MPSWRSPPPTGTASDCDGATASCASTSSPSSTIPRSPPITTGVSVSFAPPPPIARSPAVSGPIGVPISMPPSAPSSAPPQGAASTPIRPSEPPYRASPSSLRVEQIHDGKKQQHICNENCPGQGGDPAGWYIDDRRERDEQPEEKCQHEQRDPELEPPADSSCPSLYRDSVCHRLILLAWQRPLRLGSE